MTMKEFSSGMAILSSVFPTLRFITKDERVAVVWYKTLQKLSYKNFMATVEFIVKNYKQAPVPADILELVKQRKETLGAEAAWLILQEAAKKGKAIELEDWKAKAALKAIGGWNTLMYGDLDKMGIYHSQFVKAYENFEKSEAKRPANVEVLKALFDKAAKVLNDAKELPQTKNKEDK